MSWKEVAVLILVVLNGNGNGNAASAFSIDRKSWRYKGHSIAYEECVGVGKREVNDSFEVEEIPVLVLNGFGVGSFHQHRLMPHLTGGDGSSCRRVYGVDYLGQGQSWPIDCDDGNSSNERGLVYSIDTWTDQILEFIEDVILPASSTSNPHTQVHLIGNSVGGHLSAILAAKRPDLISSICLLNATPVWGLNLPGWDGVLPPPAIPRWIGRRLFDAIRDLGTIDKYLSAAYHRREAFEKDGDANLGADIRGCTEGAGGHAAFASILWSSPSTQGNDFYSILTNVQCDVLLLFGKNDPWCTPAFAKRMYQSLTRRSRRRNQCVQRYVELENVGHCPNHEAPTAVGRIASRWMGSSSGVSGGDRNGHVDRHARSLSLFHGESKEMDTHSGTPSLVWSVDEPWGEVVAREVPDSEIALSWTEQLLTRMV